MHRLSASKTRGLRVVRTQQQSGIDRWNSGKAGPRADFTRRFSEEGELDDVPENSSTVGNCDILAESPAYLLLDRLVNLQTWRKIDGRPLANQDTDTTKPMNAPHHVLIVTQNCARGGDLGGWLRSEGYCVTCVSTFAAARVYLQMNPSVVITELKLGAYNGLHLAVRANSSRIPVLVLGDRDSFFEHEARQLGTTYISFDEATRERIVSYVGTQIRYAPASLGHNLAWIGPSAISSVRAESSEPRATLAQFPSNNHRIRVH